MGNSVIFKMDIKGAVEYFISGKEKFSRF